MEVTMHTPSVIRKIRIAVPPPYNGRYEAWERKVPELAKEKWTETFSLRDEMYLTDCLTS